MANGRNGSWVKALIAGGIIVPFILGFIWIGTVSERTDSTAKKVEKLSSTNVELEKINGTLNHILYRITQLERKLE